MQEYAELAPESVEEEIDGLIRMIIERGFAAESDAIDEVMQMMDDDYAPISAPKNASFKARLAKISKTEAAASRQLQLKVTQRVIELYAEARVTQLSWGTTDGDRLDAAFVELERQYGLIARHDYACCSSCGLHSLKREFREGGKRSKGYTFYCVQTTDYAMESGELHLQHGAFDTEGYCEHDRDLGLTIASVMQAHGLKINWNGKADTTIQVACRWPRRVPIESTGNPTMVAGVCVIEH